MERLNALVGNSAFEFLLKIIVAGIAILLPIHSVLGAMITLIVFDFVSGIFAALHLKERITTRKLSRTPGKILFYLMCVIAAFVFENYIFSTAPITQITAAFVASTELKSIYENVDKVYHLNLWPHLKEHLKHYLNKWLKK